MIGTILAHYEITHHLGSGGMGEAADGNTERPKVLSNWQATLRK